MPKLSPHPELAPRVRPTPKDVFLIIGPGLSASDYTQLSDQARNHDKVERAFKKKFKDAIFEAAFRALDSLAAGEELNLDEFDFESLVVENAIGAMAAGLKKPRVESKHLARPNKSLRTIFQMWDRWRKKPSKQQKKNASDIKKVFLHTVQSFWKAHSHDFRRGDTYDMTAVREEFTKRAKIPIARANMIVQTSTSSYYNKAIVDLYKNAESITHYLFAAILDRRTTKWCCEYQKGGRHGLIYKKGAKVTKREVPAIHWNCRSTFLPLSISNPKHRILILDKARLRENHKPTPLPKGWNT